MPQLKTTEELTSLTKRILANGPKGLEGATELFQALSICIELQRRDREQLLDLDQHALSESLFRLCSEASRARHPVVAATDEHPEAPTSEATD